MVKGGIFDLRADKVNRCRWRARIGLLCACGIAALDLSGFSAWAGPQASLNSEKGILDAIHNVLRYDSRVQEDHPNITLENGVVTLSGVVRNLKAKRAAEQDVRNIRGVREVRNLLTLSNDSVLTDEDIQRRVQGALDASKRLADNSVAVTALDGKVYLSGMVDTLSEAALAEDIASGISGVTDVSNSLHTPRYRGAFPGLGYPYRWPQDDVYRYGWPRSDAEIQDAIQERLAWNPYINAHQVKVQVKDGIASLTGVVDSRQERKAAGAMALNGGAVSVRNQLTVRPHVGS